jgi:hypothetical protein
VVTVSDVKEHLAWIAKAAWSEHIVEDVNQVGYTLVEALLEKLHTVARHEATRRRDATCSLLSDELGLLPWSRSCYCWLAAIS